MRPILSIFTDASVIRHRSAFAVVVDTHTALFGRAPPMIRHSMDAEGFAIYRALQWVDATAHPDAAVHIYTDCLGWVQGSAPYHPLYSAAMRRTWLELTSRIPIRLMYVPSHDRCRWSESEHAYLRKLAAGNTLAHHFARRGHHCVQETVVQLESESS